MNTKMLLFGLVGVLLACGCASSTRTVRCAVPPRVDLRSFPMVGLVTFSTNGDRGLDRLSTQRFLEALQSAQPGTRVVELGSEADVLKSVHRRSWDAQTLRAIKETHGVDVVVMGRLDVEKAKPNFQLSTFMRNLSANVDVNAALNCRLIETASGATMWADGSAMTANLAHADVSGRSGSFGASDPEAVYGKMVDGLVWQVTDAFRVHYVFRRVPADQVVASAD